MITIKITKTTDIPYEETVNFIVSETATGKTGKESNYGDEKPLFDKKYAPSVAKKVRTETIFLLEQNITNEGEFDLSAVIRAVNGL